MRTAIKRSESLKFSQHDLILKIESKFGDLVEPGFTIQRLKSSKALFDLLHQNKMKISISFGSKKNKR